MMIDVYEKTTVQDMTFAKALGIRDGEVRNLSLYQMKNELHVKAFQLRKNNQTITQREANVLNSRLTAIIEHLEVFGYDASTDYMIDFDSFVEGNESYNQFSW